MKNTANTILSAVNYFKDELNEYYDASELEQILQITFSFFFKLARVDLTIKSADILSEGDFNKVKEVVTELKLYKPLAQIIGEWEFYGITIQVNEHTLIPRPETEELVELIINENKTREQPSILDIGTGSGCIALAIKKNIPSASVCGFDISENALKVASDNANKNNLAVTFNVVDVLSLEALLIRERYDIIVSNPPYITHKEKELMSKNVLDYEPYMALFVADNTPLLFYKAIADFAVEHLKENGSLYFEINENYGTEVQQLLIEKKFKNINIVKDINEKDRIVHCNL